MKKLLIATAAVLGLSTAAYADQLSFQSVDTTVAALGGLETASVDRGEFGWGTGVAMTWANDEDAYAGAVGMNYGISDTTTLNVKAARSFNKDAYAAFVGIAFRF